MSTGKERLATKHAAAGEFDGTGGARSVEASQETWSPSARNVVEGASGGPQPARNSKVRWLRFAILAV